MSAAVELTQFVLGCALSGLGFLTMLAGAIGGLRFRDGLARLHLASLGELGNALALAGLACFASNVAQAALLLTLSLGCLLFGAGARHALADATNAAGIEGQTLPRAAETRPKR